LISSQPGLNDLPHAARPWQFIYSLTGVKGIYFSFSFGRKIANKYHQPLVSNSLAFLESLFCEKLTCSELSGFQESMVYKAPGRALQQSFYTWFVESALSLTVKQLVQSFNIWLNQASTARFLTSIENTKHLFGQSRTQPTPQMAFLSQSAGDRVVQKEAHDVLQTVEKILHAVYSKGGGDDFSLPSFQAIQSWLTVYAVNRADETGRRFEIPASEISTSQARVFVLPQPRAEREQFGWTQPQPGFREEKVQATPADIYRRTSLAPTPLAFSAHGLAERIEEVYFTRHFTSSGTASRIASGVAEATDKGYRLPTGAFVSRSPATVLGDFSQNRQADPETVFHWPAALSKIENWFEHKQRMDLTLTKVKKASVQISESVLLENARADEFANASAAAFAPLLNRKLVAGAISALEASGGDQDDDFISELTFLRREEQMQPPRQSYAYAQPMRSTIEEERVVKKVQEKEVVEIVRKQVETVMKSRSPMEELTRSDLSRLADQVYSSLARRLMMEKERLGLNY